MKTNYFSKLVAAAMLLVSSSSFAEEVVRWTPDYPGMGFLIENDEASLKQIATEATFENQTLDIPASVNFDGVDYPVTSIAATAVAWKTDGIEKVVVPESVKSIGDNAFSNSTCIKEVELSEGVETIGIKAFELCSSLEKVNLPKSITKVGDAAFTDCSSLAEMTFPAGFDGMGTSLFVNCTSLKKVYFPESLTTMGGWSFQDCTGLEEIHFAGATPIETFSGTGAQIWNTFKCTDGSNHIFTVTKLYVPTGSLDAYQKTIWGNAQTFNGRIFEEGGSSSISKNSDSKVRAYSANGQLVVKDATTGSKLDVFSTIGQQVYSSVINGTDCTVSLPTGLYVVKVDNNSFKVMCK